MYQHAPPLIHKFRFVLGGVYIITCVVLLAVAISVIAGRNAHADASSSQQTTPDSFTVTSYNDPLATVSRNLTHATDSTQANLVRGSRTLTTSVARSSMAVAHGGAQAVNGTYTGIAFVGRNLGSGAWFVTRNVGSGILYGLRVPGRLTKPLANSAAVGTVIRPADHEPVPVIDPKSPALAKARVALNAPVQATPASQPAPVTVSWPLHGIITTEFGVPEPPYQPIHTGIDISDGKAPGITPVKAFRQGRVIDVEHSGGLGNHVVVDHGNGVTSVYGHLNSIAVSVGQLVDTTTTVGYEGTTGVSTGTHLHFEIRVNGQATNPHLFIPGQPY